MSWAERHQAETQAIASLSKYPEYAALIDVYEGELRAIWRSWLAVETAEEAEKIRTKAIVWAEVLEILRGKESEADEDNEARQQMKLQEADHERILEALAQGQVSSQDSTQERLY